MRRTFNASHLRRAADPVRSSGVLGVIQLLLAEILGGAAGSLGAMANRGRVVGVRPSRVIIDEALGGCRIDEALGGCRIAAHTEGRIGVLGPRRGGGRGEGRRGETRHCRGRRRACRRGLRLVPRSNALGGTSLGGVLLPLLAHVGLGAAILVVLGGGGGGGGRRSDE